MNNKLHALIIFVFLLFFNCAINDFTQVKFKHSTRINKNILTQKQIKEITPTQLATLFYKQNSIPKKTKPKIKPFVQKKKKVNYKVIVDWQINGKRFVKLRDITTGKELVVNNYSAESGIILLKRTLYKYIFKINNKIVEIKR